MAEQISAKKLNSLLKDARATYKETRSLAGDLGQTIKSAVEHDNLHRKAFSMIRALDRLEAEKLAATMDAFFYYYDVSGLEERAKSAPTMIDGDIVTAKFTQKQIEPLDAFDDGVR